MCRHFGNSTIIFWRFYSSRPGLGVSTQVKFYEKLHKNRVSVAVRCWFGSSTELKFKKVSLPSHARTLRKSFKVCFLGHLCTQKRDSKSSYQKWKSFTQNYKKRDATAQLQETAHQIWLILKPKTYCFSPHPSICLAPKSPAKKRSKTLERLSKEAYFARETKLNLHILSFRHTGPPRTSSSSVHPEALPNKPAKSREPKTYFAGRPKFSSFIILRTHTRLSSQRAGWCRFKVEKLVQIILA